MPRPLRVMTAADAAGRLPLEEQVQRRAWELYVTRGNQSGSEAEDWEQAEDEIREASEQQQERG
jgi:hypothetical protein